jgi:hypothetical protein
VGQTLFRCAQERDSSTHRKLPRKAWNQTLSTRFIILMHICMGQWTGMHGAWDQRLK